MVVRAGETPPEIVRIKDSHFTLLFISDLTSAIRFLVLIYAAERLKAYWSLGLDIFAELNKDDPSNNYGPDKRYPGVVLYPADSEEIPVLFKATPKSLMTSTVLRKSFKMMDELDITQRGVHSNG